MYHYPAALTDSEAAEIYERALSDIEWQKPITKSGCPLPRQTAWLSSGKCTCPYKYGGIEMQADAFPPWLTQLTHKVMKLCNFAAWPSDFPEPNSCNMNLYRGKHKACGWHGDDEDLWGNAETIIISLSVGATRDFDISFKDQKKKYKSLSLQHGDLCMMSGWFQNVFDHRVPFSQKQVGNRINFTWRWIANHVSGCVEHGSPAPHLNARHHPQPLVRHICEALE